MIELLSAITASTQHASRAAQVAEGRRNELHSLIRTALASGASVADLVRATGLTRARIYQIRDGRR